MVRSEARAYSPTSVSIVLLEEANLTPAAARPYLRFASSEALRDGSSRASLSKWLWRENAGSAFLADGRTVSTTFTTICNARRDAPASVARMGRSSSPTTGLTKSRSAMPSCASSKAVFETNWTRCSVPRPELRSIAL